jgi:MFS family permease
MRPLRTSMQTGHSSPPANTGLFYGWWVISALFFVGMLGPMGRYTITTFAPFMKQEMGWDATSLGLALSISLGVYALASIPVGWMLDRRGSRPVILLGGCFVLLGLGALSAVRQLWHLYVSAGILVSLGVSMTHFLTTQSTARKWFNRKAGLAAGILTAAFWLGAGILSPVLTGLAGHLNWRTTCLGYAIASGTIIVLLAALVIRDTPESMGLRPDGDNTPEEAQEVRFVTEQADGTVKEVLGTPSFWLILVGYCLLGIPGQGLLGHLVLWGSELGTPKATTGLFLTGFTFACGLTAFVGGWLADAFGKRRVLMGSYALSTIILLVAWLAVGSSRNLFIFAVVFGMVYGVSAGPGLWAAYVGDLFGRANLGRLFGILTLGYGLIGGVGPLLWGKIHDTTGAYNPACLISALCFPVTILCLAAAKPMVSGNAPKP